MAKKSAHQILAEWVWPSGNRRAVTSTGILLTRAKRGRWKRAGYVTPGLTLGEIDAVFRGTRGDGETEVVRLRIGHDAVVPNPVARHKKRMWDRKRRRDQRKAQESLQRKREVELLTLLTTAFGQENGPMRAAALRGIEAYVTECLRLRRRPLDGRLQYVYGMARFNGGDTGGYLGTAVDATWSLPSDVTEMERKVYDAVADVCAVKVFGSANAAARRWRKALYGE